MSFDFNPKTNVLLRRWLLILSIGAVFLLYPILVIETAVLVSDPAGFVIVLTGLAFAVAVIPLLAAVLLRRSVRPLVRLYQPLALAGLPLVTFPMDTVIVLAVGGAWLYAHWMLVEFRAWGVTPAKDPKPAPAPMANYIDTDKGPKSAPVPAKQRRQART